MKNKDRNEYKSLTKNDLTQIVNQCVKISHFFEAAKVIKNFKEHPLFPFYYKNILPENKILNYRRTSKSI